MIGSIVMECPAMLTTRVSWWERLTSEIHCPTFINLPNEVTLTDDVVFPVCSIRKKFGLIWQVDKVTARGKLVEVTLEPEWVFASLAFKVKASGRLLDSPGVIEMTFPRVWSRYTGPGKWTVDPVLATGMVRI